MVVALNWISLFHLYVYSWLDWQVSFNVTYHCLILKLSRISRQVGKGFSLFIELDEISFYQHIDLLLNDDWLGFE